MKIFKRLFLVLFLIFMSCSKDSKIKDSDLLNEIILEIEELDKQTAEILKSIKKFL